MAIPFRSIIRGAILTVLTLFGGIFLGGVLGNVVFETFSGHSVVNPNPVHVVLGIIPAVAGILAGSGAWGWAMGGLAEQHERRPLVLAGILGFLPTTAILAVVLLNSESIVAEMAGVRLPTHRVFTFLFVPTAFLIAGISSWAIGKGLRDDSLALAMSWKVGLASALAFLAVNIAMEASGWIVGAPGAAERDTMVTVMLAGNLGAALAGGAVMGWMLQEDAPSSE